MASYARVAVFIAEVDGKRVGNGMAIRAGVTAGWDAAQDGTNLGT